MRFVELSSRATILWNPSPVLADTLSPPCGERDGARGAFGFDPNVVKKSYVMDSNHVARELWV
jgi:hypothetical protein